MRKRMARSLDLSKLTRDRSVYHMCLCKAMGTTCATNICPFVKSFILSGATNICPFLSHSFCPTDNSTSGQ